MKMFTLLFAISLSLTAHAITIDGITFNDQTTVDGKELVLNGVGIRKATMLKIKVYYGGLYLSAKTQSAEDFLNTAEPKQIIMHFVRNVSAKDLKQTYSNAFAAANKDTHASMSEIFTKFNAQFERNVQKGERMIFTFTNKGVSLKFGETQGEVMGDENFSKAILRMWFINPQDQNLADGLLGKKSN